MDSNSSFNEQDNRGKRLKELRNLANVSREELCNVEYLNINTYKGWELSRHGGLTKNGANSIIKRVYDFGVICSFNWLFEGKGNKPFFFDTSDINLNKANIEDNILNEIYLFMNSHSNAIYTKIENDFMIGFNSGDYVGGVKHFGNAINDCVNRICIVEVDDGKILVKLLAKDTNNKYMLLSTKNNGIDNYSDVNILSAAPILRHYITDVK